MGVDRSERRVGVLCGGPGAERAVSLQSGAAVTRGLGEAGIPVEQVDVSGAADEIRALPFDLVFLALHGEFGEDGTIQALLDEARMPYTGSSAACCTLTINKIETKRRLRAAGLPTPAWVDFASPAEGIEAARALPLPVVVKPASRGSSVGTTIVRAAGELAAALELALAVDRQGLVEAFVEGCELTAGMLAGEALPLIELQPARDFYDYEAKYKDDRTEYCCPAPLEADASDALQRLGLAVNEALGVEHLGRVDMILGEDGPMVLEVNTIPGFTSHSLLPMAAREAGVGFPELCRRILELAWERGPAGSGSENR